jgi:hypothetical protein
MKNLQLLSLCFDGGYMATIVNKYNHNYVTTKNFIGYNKREVLHKLVNDYNVIVPSKFYNKPKKIDTKVLPMPLQIIYNMRY